MIPVVSLINANLIVVIKKFVLKRLNAIKSVKEIPTVKRTVALRGLVISYLVRDRRLMETAAMLIVNVCLGNVIIKKTPDRINFICWDNKQNNNKIIQTDFVWNLKDKLLLIIRQSLNF